MKFLENSNNFPKGAKPAPLDNARCVATVYWLRAGETVKRRRLAAVEAGSGRQPGTEPSKILVGPPKSDTADIEESIGSSAESILHSLR